MTFKEKLVILRKARGLTQDEFASAVGVSRQAVYKWECGQSYPEVPKLLEMKLLFNISIDNLLDDSYDIPLPEKKKRRRAKKDNTASAEVPVVKAAPVKAEPQKKVEAPSITVRPAAVKVEEPKKPATVKVEEPKAAQAPKKDSLSAVQEILASINTAPISTAASVETPKAPAAPKAPTVTEEPKVRIPSVKEVEKEDKIKIPSINEVETSTLSDTNEIPTITKVESDNDDEPKKVGLFGRLFGRK